MNADLPPQDWNFDDVPDSELVACCYWEYARESAFIRDVKRRCVDPRWRNMANREAWQFVGGDLERIQSIGHPAEVFLRGFFFDEAEDRQPGHPDAPPITGSFPKAWQSLDVAERKYRARIRSARESIPLVPFRRGHAFFAEDIARWYKPRRASAKPGEEIHPSLFPPGSEVGVFEICWGDFTDDELAEGFRKWVKSNRPKQFPKPSGQGHKPGDWRAHLSRLAVMRLLSRFTALELVAEDEFPAIWKKKQFAGRKWGDVTKWHDARREAGKLFHSLFPFVPKDEKPISWNRQAPAK